MQKEINKKTVKQIQAIQDEFTTAGKIQEM